MTAEEKLDKDHKTKTMPVHGDFNLAQSSFKKDNELQVLCVRLLRKYLIQRV
jgi:hypothetical protein